MIILLTAVELLLQHEDLKQHQQQQQKNNINNDNNRVSQLRLSINDKRLNMFVISHKLIDFLLIINLLI
jgi:hypothetical protein